MSTAPTTAAPAANETAGTVAPKVEDQGPSTQGTNQPGNGDSPQVNWDSEIQLVSSLAKLQELERKIHELRQFVPDGLLQPLVPISSSFKVSSDNSAAESPPLLRSGLDQAARSRLANIENFQSMWRGPELKPIWTHVESRIKEFQGQALQPTGIWEKDYDVLLEELVKVEKTKELERQQEEEDAERAKVQSSEGEWEAVVERFNQRNVSGVRLIKGQNPLSLAVALAKAGMLLLLEGVKEPDVAGVAEWQVSSKAPQGRSPTKLENSILECLNSRPRKWDLAYLLDMISSYADIKQTECVQCNRLTNNAAQLPTIRRPQPTQAPQGEPRTFTFDALHANCA